METLLIQNKCWYVALMDIDNNELVYFLGRIVKKENKLILIFQNPFDIWDNVPILKETLLSIHEDKNIDDNEKFVQWSYKIKVEKIRTFKYYFFESKEDIIAFLDSKETKERKFLREKYKGVSILNIPMEDLKKLGLEIPIV